MRERLPAVLAGLLFGAGLLISGMADPQRVLGFLRIGAGWDPSLAFVMGGALAVTVPGFALLRRRRRPLLAETFASPPTAPVDRRLIVGAALFGLGWGWAGYCPGPALVGFGLGHWTAIVFVPAMFAGGWIAARRLS
ncbi:DUF6691 family protein [Sinimarinibacterium flocculans]|uniref:Sulphur transport domain-containing protein n=1 Tax=Sinimarinibacterium flocculans TaxID=985250 RepID=A0A318EP03_9GAMM|nr:DUF6691 family protein [Sinimarinibacterium flocculans]MEC9363764.1 DUF6691 family protein [Pseudomonadota bacterium]PXV71236.1 hypothetical protein C8D93_101281 [Sinimarinibacterium flocculans]